MRISAVAAILALFLVAGCQSVKPNYHLFGGQDDRIDPVCLDDTDKHNLGEQLAGDAIAFTIFEIIPATFRGMMDRIRDSR